MKLLQSCLLSIALLFSGSALAEWSVQRMNEVISQTNFVVDKGCSGTLISLDQRLVLTNHHCIKRKVQTYKTKETVNGRVREVEKERLLDVPIEQKAYAGHELVGASSYMTEIVAYDKYKDLALLRIKAANIPFSIESRLLPAEKEIIRGEYAIAVGNPYGLDASVTRGVISSITRQLRVPWTDREKINLLQYDGGVSPGNSGGALYNSDGFLIGIPAMVARDSTIGMAIPVSMIYEFLDENCYPIYDGAMLSEDCSALGERKDPDEDEEDEE